MSAKKGFETKIPDDDYSDSGFLSGPLSEQLTEELDADAGREETPAPAPAPTSRECDKDVHSEVEPLDSGVDLSLSERLDGLRVEDSTPTSAHLPALYVTPEGADIPPLSILFQQDDDGDTQLHIAAVHGCEKSVGTLIRVCPEKYLLDLPNDFGHTALHLAVMSGHAVVARMLVREGAALGVRDLNGDTPVHLASAARSVECLHALLAPMDNQSPKRFSSILNMKNYAGQACIHLAATAGHRQTVQTLMHYGADVNAREGLAGWTALHIAARRGDARLATQLVSSGAAQVRARDYGGRTPRRLARKYRTFSAEDALRLLAALPDDTESETDDDTDEDETTSKRTRLDRSESTQSSLSSRSLSSGGSAAGSRTRERR